MKPLTHLLLGFALLTGCASNDKTDIADTTVNGQPFHVFREGPMPAAGVMTNIVIKPMSGVRPDQIRVWVGTAETPDSDKVVGDFDPNDGDFDNDLTCPDPLPAGAAIFFEVTEAGVVTTTNVAIK